MTRSWPRASGARVTQRPRLRRRSARVHLRPARRRAQALGVFRGRARTALRRRALQPRRRSLAGESAPQPALRRQRPLADLRVGGPLHPTPARRGVARRRSAVGRRSGAGVGARRAWRDLRAVQRFAVGHRAVQQALEHGLRRTSTMFSIRSRCRPIWPRTGSASIRIVPKPPASSSTSGSESQTALSGWGTLSWARVADDLSGGDVLRAGTSRWR